MLQHLKIKYAFKLNTVYLLNNMAINVTFINAITYKMST